MKEWWFHLNVREKQTVCVGIAVVVMMLLYGLIWLPLQHSVTSLRDEVEHNQRLLVWMQAADEKIQAVEKSDKKVPVAEKGTSCLSLVQTQLKQSLLASQVTQLAQADNDSVKLVFQTVDFDVFISWLIKLWQDQGLVVTELTMTRGNVPGKVATEFVLKK